MSLTAGQALTQVRNFLNEPVQVYWTDTEIANWIEEGCRDFSSKSLMIEDTMQVTLVTNQIQYTSSDVAALSTIIEPYSCLYNDGVNNWKGIIKMHPRMIGNEATNASGEPKYYALHHSSIYLWPPPSSTVVAGGAYLKILYAKVTSDIAIVHDEYQHLPIIYACAKCKYKDQKFAEGNALMTYYLNTTAFERQDKHSREEDSLDMFKIKPRGAQQQQGAQ